VFDVLPAHLSTICHVVILLRGVYSVWSREEEQRESIKYEKAAASHTILSKQPFRNASIKSRVERLGFFNEAKPTARKNEVPLRRLFFKLCVKSKIRYKKAT